MSWGIPNDRVVIPSLRGISRIVSEEGRDSSQARNDTVINMPHIACCQFDIAWEDKRENYRRMSELVAGANLPADTLLLLPEMFATGFTMNAALAEPLDGPTANFLADLARQNRIYIQAGLVVAGKPRPRNEAHVFDPAGNRVARYAKRHLFSVAGEDKHYVAGDEIVLFDWCGVKVA